MFTEWKRNSHVTALTVRWFPQIFIILVLILVKDNYATGCKIFPSGEYLKLVKVPKNLEKGSEIFPLEVHPRGHLKIVSVDREIDSLYFSYKEVNETHISVILDQSLEDFTEDNLLKFRIICNSSTGGESLTTSRLSVTIFVEDVNNHAPQFIDTPYYSIVDELTPIGTKIFCGIHAIDKDKPNTPNSDVYYTISYGNSEKKFSLKHDDHETCIILNKSLDYDRGERQFTLTITATDRGTSSKSSNSIVTIKVRDNDDLNPKFTQEIYKAQIKEIGQYPDKHSVYEEIHFDSPIHAFDQDEGINTIVQYDIIAGNERGIFDLDPHNGSLFLKKALDLDTEKNLIENTFVLKIQASQIDNPLKFATAKVEVEIIDVNDNLPEFEVDFYNISIVENLPNGFSVLQVVAHDKDQGQNSEFKYQLDDPSGAFSIDPNTGWLIVKDESILDREKRALIKMKVFAVEKVPNVISSFEHGSSSITSLPSRSSVDVEVALLDANDNNPTFVPSNLYELVAQSDSKVGTVLGQVHAVDKDQGRNGMVLYRLQRPGNVTSGVPFQVDSETGVISVIESPIMEGRHAIFVEATDQPWNPSERRFSLAVVAIDVYPSEGYNTGIPDFIGAPYEFWVGIEVPIGTTVGQIRTNNAVRTVALIYDLLHGYHEGVPFAIEETSGTITVVDEIKKYNRLYYDFEAVATNEKDITLITNVSIHVVDSTEKMGSFSHGTTKAPLIFHINENCANAFIGQVLPAQNDTNVPNNIHFFIANQQDVPDIDITDDGSLYTNRGLDRETKQNYSVTIVAEHLRGVAIFQVTVVIDDENDNAPVFSSRAYEGHILENSLGGTEVTMKNPISAYDPDDGINANFVFSLHGNGSQLFEINQKSGELFYKGTKKQNLDREMKSEYNMQIVATDTDNLQSTAELSIKVEDVNDNAPNFTRMVVLPDHNIQVSKESSESSSVINNSKLSVFNDGSNGEHQTEDTKKRISPILYIPENVTLGTPILRLTAHDADEAQNAEIKYEILSESEVNDSNSSNDINISGSTTVNFKTKRFFAIDSRSGDISVIRNLPAESDILLVIGARDSGNLTDHMELKIHVMDVNDHPPLFRQSFYSFEIQEGVYDKYKIDTITAFDSDFGNNANITYELIYDSNTHEDSAQFNIGMYTGDIFVSGTLDRETKNIYNLVVKARDQATDAVSLSSTTDVEIKILDINDNPPMFFGYYTMSKLDNYNENEALGSSDEKNTGQLIPVYLASVPADIPIGSKVAQIFANDSDYIGNGNGLVLFDLVNLRSEKQYFAIDSKEGHVTTIASLKYDPLLVHNLTIVVSDLGTPSLSSTARLMVTVTNLNHHHPHHQQEHPNHRSDNKIDDENYQQQKTPVFVNRYYEIQVEENTDVPLKLVQLTASTAEAEDNSLLHFSIDHEQSSSNSNYFSIDSKNGTLYLNNSVDREQKDLYEIIVRVDKVKHSRGMPFMVYPITEERLNGLAYNEAKIIVKIKDVNDNTPKFKMTDAGSRPLIAVIPTGANFGYELIKVEAEDADEGINGEIRYQILNNEEETPRFAIDPVSGQVKSVANFARDAGRVFGFDVKATDRQGAEDGLSSIINVIVYVLDDQKQVVMIMGKRPSDIEKQVDNITTVLRNMTGFDVRIRKLEPHIEKNLIDNASSDMYLYAIDPNLNIVIDTETLHNAFRNKKMEIKRELDKYNVLDITRNVPRRLNQRYLLSTLEVGVVVLGCVVFVGTLVTALCVTCIRRNKSHQRRQNTTLFSATTPAVGFALTDVTGTLQKPSFFPSVADLHSLQYDPEPFSSDMRHNFSDHESNGIRFHSLHSCRAPGGPILGKQPMRFETSATSLYSSGQDSGIVARICHCSNSYSPSSGESSNGYEDSLKSFQQNMNSRDNEGSQIHSVGTRAKPTTVFSRKHAKLHALSSLESSTAYPTQELSLSREKRYRTAMDQKHHRHMNSMGREHQRSFSEAENNITETVIHEHPGMELLIPGSRTNTLRLQVNAPVVGQRFHGQTSLLKIYMYEKNESTTLLTQFSQQLHEEENK